MSYLVFARKYRPQAFDSVSGQEHVTRTISNSIKRDKVAHAILLSGPRGVGKTSIARIIAKCLNCETGLTAEPCLTCTNCIEITQGTSLAVREIDGASHNSVDNVRELMETFRSLPAPGSRYKVYIIDEVHMLSTAAFNALLKSLEEPPPHTVFILATTEVHKIPETVLSRCQRHDLRALSMEAVEGRLRHIAVSEKLKVEEGVFRLIARLSDGSMRDAQSLFDRVQAFSEGEITVKDASKLLGAADKTLLFEITKNIFSHDVPLVLSSLGDAFSTGIDTTLFIKDLVQHFRELLIAKCGGDSALTALGVGEDDKVQLLRQVQPLGRNDVQDICQIAREGCESSLRSSYPKYSLEALMVRLATREPVAEMGELISRLKSAGIARQGAPSALVYARENVAEKKIIPIHPEKGDGDMQSANPVSKTSHTLDWTSFVKFAGDAGLRVISEHLKRLSVVTFSPGLFEARGPEFSISSLQSKSDKEKLSKALSDFSNIDKWTIHLNTGDTKGIPEPGSIAHGEHTKKVQTRQDKEKAISSHPKIQSLQKAFPGTKIEGIKTKER